ncbi:MAG: hypothetical protein ACR2QV_08965 [Gammaproteobacteria bacterium]
MNRSTGELRPVICRDQITGIFLPQCFILAALLAGCAESGSDLQEPAEDASDRVMRVYAVNYPLAYFAERIGSDAVDVRFPVPAGVDPAAWVPDPDTIAEYQ